MDVEQRIHKLETAVTLLVEYINRYNINIAANANCARPHSLTLSLIPGKLFPTSSGSSSDFIAWTTLKMNDWSLQWFLLFRPL